MNEDLSIEFDENGTDHVRVTKQSSCQGIIFDGVPLEIVNPGIGDGLVIDNIGISSNVISSKSGGGNTIFIDPYPDGFWIVMVWLSSKVVYKLMELQLLLTLQTHH